MRSSLAKCKAHPIGYTDGALGSTELFWSLSWTCMDSTWIVVDKKCTLVLLLMRIDEKYNILVIETLLL